MIKSTIAATLIATSGNALCMPVRAAHEALTNEYHEQLITRAVDDIGRQIETWANLETGQYTIIVYMKDGGVCVASYGSGFTLGEVG